MVRHIGVSVVGSVRGSRGGLDVYSESVVSALRAEADVQLSLIGRHSDFASDGQLGLAAGGTRTIVADHRRTLTCRVRRRLLRYLGAVPMENHQLLQLDRQLQTAGVEVVHFPCTVMEFFTDHVASVLTVFDLQHYYYPEFFTDDELAWREARYGPSIERADHLVVPSWFTGQSLRERFGVGEEKMTVVPVSVGNDFYRRPEDEIAVVRQRLALPEHYVFYPANPWRHKNHATLMAALRIYRQKYGDCPWLVVSGRLRDERREAQSLAVAAGVSDRFLDLGYAASSDLPALYSGAAALVFPSLFEGFGIPLVEAMACGCPIVAADATTSREITDGAALLVSPLDAEGFAVAMHRVITEDDVRSTLVDCGDVNAKKYRPGVMARGLREAYELARKRAGGEVT